MALARAGLQSSESIWPSAIAREISSRSASVNAIAERLRAVVECRRSEPERLEPRYERD
jgi:hypothetical protein